MRRKSHFSPSNLYLLSWYYLSVVHPFSSWFECHHYHAQYAGFALLHKGPCPVLSLWIGRLPKPPQVTSGRTSAPMSMAPLLLACSALQPHLQWLCPVAKVLLAFWAHGIYGEVCELLGFKAWGHSTTWSPPLSIWWPLSSQFQLACSGN